MSEYKSAVELHAAIAKKAYADPEFMKRLEESPKEVLEEELGEKLPDKTVVKLHKNSIDEIYIPLPITSDQLKESDLEGVSGGIGPIAIAGIGLSVFAIYLKEGKRVADFARHD